jgi:hypothetical protein
MFSTHSADPMQIYAGMRPASRAATDCTADTQKAMMRHGTMVSHSVGRDEPAD